MEQEVKIIVGYSGIVLVETDDGERYPLVTADNKMVFADRWEEREKTS